MLRKLGDGLDVVVAAGTDILHLALGQMGGLTNHRSYIIMLMLRGRRFCYRRLGHGRFRHRRLRHRRLGHGRLGCLRHSRLNSGLLGHKAIADRAAMGCIVDGVDAHQAGAGAVQQPAQVFQCLFHIGGNLLCLAAGIHQRRKAQLPIHRANGKTGIHISAGSNGAVGNHVAQHQIIGVAGIHRILNHSHVAPMLVIGIVHIAPCRCINRLGGGNVHIVMLREDAAGIGRTVQGVGLVGTAACIVHNIIVKFLGQREVPAFHGAVSHLLALLLGQLCGSCHFLCMGMQVHFRQYTGNQNCTQKQRYRFLKYRFLHDVSLLSSAAVRHWYLHYT